MMYVPDLTEFRLGLEREECRRSLYRFVQLAWPHFEAVQFQDGWHIEAICLHLEAVTRGDIDALLINIPPRMAKTSLVLLWMVWTWTLDWEEGGYNYRRGPTVQFLSSAYNGDKAREDGLKARLFMRSDWFQERWGDTVKISPYADNATKYATVEGGYRISVGIPESMGKGGLIRTIDDPSKADEVESDAAQQTVARNYDEIWSTRSNDPVHGAEVVVMQRLGAGDLTGHLLDRTPGKWCHLCIPFGYDPERHCTTSIGWHDPRGCDDDTGEPLAGVGQKEPYWSPELALRAGEPVWPERFSERWGREQEALIGPYAWAAQFQQIPAPRGGGVITSDMWRLWEKPAFPDFDLVVVSYDGAYTDKSYNDPSAVTVWGRFWLDDVRAPQFMLIWSWQERKMMHEVMTLLERTCLSARGTRVLETHMDLPNGGLRANVLLIEAKANGLVVGQEMVRLHGKRKWRTLLCNVKGDKMARLKSVQHLFVGRRRGDGTYEPGQVWCPDTVPCQSVIDEVAMFPKAGQDHKTDTVSQALRWMRDQGAAQTPEEAEDDWIERNSYRKPRKALYPNGGR
jgi:phage terminase large subunit-like protein